jgi:PAS domain S-box-containing protein
MGYTVNMRSPISRPAAQRSHGVPDEGRSTAPDIKPIHTFAEASPAAVVVLAGPAHRILYANPALCAAAGRSPDDLLGRTTAEAFPHLDASGQVVAALDRLRAAGSPWTCRAQPLRLPLDEGEPRVWDVEATPLRNGGACTGLLLQLRDVSAQRRAEAALQDALAAQQAIAREAEHRIKNSLQLVASLLRLQASHMTEPVGRRGGGGGDRAGAGRGGSAPRLAAQPRPPPVRLSDLLDELAAGHRRAAPRHGPPHGSGGGPHPGRERAIPLALVLANWWRRGAPRRGQQPRPRPCACRAGRTVTRCCSN